MNLKLRAKKTKESIKGYIKEIGNGFLTKEKFIGPELSNLQGMKFSPDGKKILVAGDCLSLYSSETKELIWKYNKFNENIREIRFIKNGDLIIILTEENSILTFDSATGTEIKKKNINIEKNISVATLNSNGKIIAIGTKEGEVILLSYPEFDLIHSFRANQTKSDINKILFNMKENEIALVYGRKMILIYNLEYRLSTIDIVDNQTDLTVIGYSSDDRYLAIGDAQGTIKIFNTEKQLKEDFRSEKLMDHITGLKFKPNQSNTLIVSDKNYIFIWNISGKGKLVNTIEMSKFLLRNIRNFEVFLSETEEKLAICSYDEILTIDNYFSENILFKKFEGKSIFLDLTVIKIIPSTSNFYLIVVFETEIKCINIDDCKSVKWTISSKNEKREENSSGVIGEGSMNRNFINCDFDRSNKYEDIFSLAVRKETQNKVSWGVQSFKDEFLLWEIELPEEARNISIFI